MSNATATDASFGHEFFVPLAFLVLGLVLICIALTLRVKVEPTGLSAGQKRHAALRAKVHQQRLSFAFERRSLEAAVLLWRYKVRLDLKGERRKE